MEVAEINMVEVLLWAPFTIVVVVWLIRVLARFVRWLAHVVHQIALRLLVTGPFRPHH